MGNPSWLQLWQSVVVNGAKHQDRRHWLAVGRHPARRDGAIALALLLLPAGVALVLERRHHHLDIATVTVLVSVALGLPVLWLAWATYRDASRSHIRVREQNLAEIADQLAVAVGTQWDAEAAIRRLNDPYPLPVSWVAADASLTDAWDSLVRLASSGAGWSSPPPTHTWAAGPEGLAGTCGDLVNVLTRVPTGRMVVLGEPGAGKTMLLVRLVLDLLNRRASGSPVPILAAMASWNPLEQDLRDWLAAQLITDHPALVGASPPGIGQTTQAAALLDAGLILPILDGLDEIPDAVRGRAIASINDTLRPGEQIVVSCRIQHYRDVARPEHGTEVALRAAAAVRLCPLDADDVCRYLRDDSGGPVTAARWDPVIDRLGTQAPAGRALVTPLAVGLARAIYNPRPGELAGELRDPGELCSPSLADRGAVESHLFDAFIPAAYRPGHAVRWTALEAETWLVFLARHLEYKITGPDLAWWQLPQAVPPVIFLFAFGIAGGLAIGLAIGLTIGLVFGLGAGLASGLDVGLALGSVAALAFALIFVSWKPLQSPQARWRFSIRCLVLGFITAIPAGLGFGLFDGFLGGLVDGLITGLVIGTITGLSFWLVFELVPRLVARSTFQNWKALRSLRDRCRLITSSIASGFPGGVAFGLAFGLSFALTGELTFGLSHARQFIYGSTAAVRDAFHFAFQPAIELATGTATGTAAGVVAGIRFTNWRPVPSRTVRWRPRVRSLLLGFSAALLISFATTLPTILHHGHGYVFVVPSFTPPFRPAFGLDAALALEIAVGLVVGLLAGLRHVPGDLTMAASPHTLFTRDRGAALLLLTATVSAFGLAVWFLVGSAAALDLLLALFALGGFSIGLATCMLHTAWPSYGLARIWLAAHHELPWRLMGFLADAHRRGVLRQVGGVYQFRHIELQHRLATRPITNGGS